MGVVGGCVVGASVVSQEQSSIFGHFGVVSGGGVDFGCCVVVHPPRMPPDENGRSLVPTLA